MPYLVDGDNLVGTERRRRGTPDDRDALVAEIADRLRRTRASVVLFFDGSGRASALGSLEVRYSGAVPADDAIVREIARAPRAREIIVATADRELARRAKDAGASSISPSEFWKRFGKSESKSPSSREARVDVDEWVEWFSDESNRGS